MRCLALAQAAREQAVSVRLIGRISVSWVREYLANTGIPFVLVPGEIPHAERLVDLLARLKEVKPPAWVVLDGYHFGPDCQKAVCAAGYKLLVIDDYAHLPEYQCDILLNQNVSAEGLAYKGDIGQKLLGPKYALLRPEFRLARQKAEARQFPEKAQNILLSLGGGDFSEHLARIAPDFTLPGLADHTLRVIAGAMPENRIRELLRGCPAEVEILGRVDDMPGLVLDTDLCVTAGGSTCWELCCLGVPFLTVEVAENQRRIGEGLKSLGFASEFTRSAFVSALAERFPGKSVQKLMALVDGEGCQRVLETIASVPAIFLRQALLEDCMAVLALANDQQVRANAISGSQINEVEHVRWYAERLKVEDSQFYLAFFRDALVGYVRYDETDTPKKRVVTIAIVEAWRGRKIGTWLLQESARQVFVSGTDSIIAWVKPENIASQKAFQRAGYVFEGQKYFQGRPMCCFQLRAE